MASAPNFVPPLLRGSPTSAASEQECVAVHCLTCRSFLAQIQGGAGRGRLRGGRRASGLELDVVVNGVEAVRHGSRKSRSSSSARPGSAFMGADRDRPQRQRHQLRISCFSYAKELHIATAMVFFTVSISFL